MNKTIKARAEAYPLLVEELIEGPAGEGGYFSKGHQDKEEFANWVSAYGETVGPDAVEHVLWRCVPWWEGGEYVGYRFLDTKPGRGAFPATVIWLGWKAERLDEEPVRVGTTAPELQGVG